MKIGIRFSAFASALVLSIVSISSTARAAGVSFDQVSWGNGSGGYEDQNSQWGEAAVSFSPTDAGSLTPFGSGYMGFVNIVTSVGAGSNNNWAVQNMPVVFDQAGELGNELPVTYQFDLGQTDGSSVASLNYSLTLSPFAVGSEPGGPLTSASVAAATDVQGTTAAAGSEGDEEAGPATDSEGAGTSGATASTAGRGGIATSDRNVPVVTEQVNGCAPGAAARSIRYLGNMYPSLNVTQSAQQIYGTLTNLMMSSTGPNSSGTRPNNFVNGKNTYFTTNGLAIAPTVVTNSFASAISALSSTGDVELGVNWGTNGGGHCVFVTGITTLYTNGVPYRYVVTAIQDPNQGGGSTTNESVTYTFDTSGNFANRSGGVNSFRIEMAMVPEPSSMAMAALGLGALGLALAFRKPKQSRT